MIQRTLFVAFTIISLLFLPITRPFPAPHSVVTAQGTDPSIAGVFTSRPPTIDGKFQPGEWDAATLEPFTFFMIDLTTGQDTIAVPADLYVMNDQKNLYLGLRIFSVAYNNSDVTGQGYDAALLLFDNDNNGAHELDEDEKLLLTIQPSLRTAQRGFYQDLHVVGNNEDNVDPRINGLGRIVHSNVTGIGDYTIEFELPLNSGDEFDFATNPSGRVRFNLIFATRLGVAAEGGGLYGFEFGNARDWGVIQLQAGQATPDPTPSLSGTIATITREFDDGRQVYLMNADGSNLRTRSQGNQLVSFPFLSPDGQRVVYTSSDLNKDGGEIVESREIYSVMSNNGRPRRLTNNRTADSHPVVSPDGRTIIFERAGNIWTMSVNGGTERQITSDGADVEPSWTPDGRIVFGSYRWGPVPEVAVMNANGTNITRITNNPKGSLSPRVSPDGQWVTFFRYEGPGSITNFELAILFDNWSINRIRLDGTGQQQLVNDASFNINPAFSPDGRGILYMKHLDLYAGYSVLHYIDLQTGRDSRVLNLSRVEAFDWR